jgi:fibronectin-binding autotransporter adhesin
MKDQLFETSSNRLAVLAALGTVALSFAMGGSTVYAGFDLGDAANYGVLFQGGGGNQLNINNGPGLAGLAANGNIGIGGTGALQLSGPLVVNGNVDFAGAVIDNGPYSGNITVNGLISGSHANVQGDLNYLNSLSTTLGAEAGAAVSINIGNGANQTINASAGTIDASGNSVFNINSINFVNGATLTINGDGTHSVVLNFSAAATFGGKILLTGGLTSDQVLFNIFGGSGATLSGGPTLSINSNGDTLTGTFLDPFGQVSIVHSVLDGRIFGGDSHDEQIVSGALVNAPTSSVPDGGSTVLLLSMGMGLIVAARKKLVAAL